MGRLKPIGSEKLEGMDKIARIMEIARYKENIPTPVNEHSSNEYSIKLADGYLYEIAKEKNGYVIKKGLNESSLDYVEPMKNRRHFSSYSGAFKRLNVIAKEVNSLTETEEGISLFTEQKKYILKAPKSMEEQAEPAPAPAPEEQPMPEPVAEPTPEEQPMPEPEMPSEEEPTQEDDEEISMKTIQKLTGKLAQKIRAYDSNEEEEMSPQDVKYVINSILSALDLDKLEDEDKEEIIDKVEGDGEESGEELMVTEPEAPSTEEMPQPEEGGEEMPEPPQEMTEYEYLDDEDEESFGFDFDFDDEPKKPYINKIKGRHDEKTDKFLSDMFENIFSESKVEKILKGYYNISESEKKQNIIKESVNNRTIASKIQTIAESKRQEESARKFVKNNPTATLIGKSSKNNLLFECEGKTIKVTTNGQIL
jgi:hypothetical protein